MSGSTSSSLNTLENSPLQESLISKSRSASGPSTPSLNSSRPSSASSATGLSRNNVSRPSSEKKVKGKGPVEKREQKTLRAERQPSKASTPGTSQLDEGLAQSVARPQQLKGPIQPASRFFGSPSGSSVTTPGTEASGASSEAKKLKKKRFEKPRRDAVPKANHTFFEPYFCLADVQEGLKRGELIEGVLRINPKSYEDAYISAPNGGLDLYVGGIRDRNRALTGDVVVLKLKPSNEWKILEENVYNHLALHPEEKAFFGVDRIPALPHIEHLNITPKEAAVVIGAVTDELIAGESVLLPVAEAEEVIDAVEHLDESVKKNKRKTRRGKRGGKKKSEGERSGSDLEIEEEVTGDAEVKAKCVPPDELSGEEFSNESNAESVDDIEAELELLENFDNIKIVDKAVKQAAKDIAKTQEREEKSKSKADRGGKAEKWKNGKTKPGKNGISTTPGKVRKEKELPFAYTKKESEKNKFDIEALLKHPNSERFVQRTAKVVYISEHKHSRCAVGHLRATDGVGDSKNYAYFSPTDHRVPRMYIPLSECPVDFSSRADDYAKVLFVAKIQKWDMIRTCFGSMVRTLGVEGDIEVETTGMLIENAVDYSEFDDAILTSLPKTPWSIPEEEFSYRKDFRKQCVFTIDPSTARDLDDAVSCIPLTDGRFRVGVHIADVSFFIKENTALDTVASQRATSVYLVQKVVPMLPRLLCEQLCSLNPGEDRLTFSVEWVIDENGDIEEEWFGRSVIRSCVKMAYEHAQSIIENPGKYDWKEGEIPEIEAPFSIREVCDAVTNLQKIACNLRRRRQVYGALRLDLPKMFWALDKETGMPTGFKIYELRDSNRLIEELMLLANMAVARRIYTTYPEVALLRCHPPPQELMIQEVAECLASIGIHLDITSSSSIQSSLLRYYGCLSELPRREGREFDPELEDWAAVGRAIVMTNLIAKPMVCAKYICSGTMEDPTGFRHYALAVPLYTHFTSPIRRYPDVIVHRLLASSLGYCDPPHWDKHTLRKTADWCNDRKTTAKRVGDMSSEMFLGLFIKTIGPLVCRAVVLQVLDRSLDVVLLNSGLIKRVYMDKLPLASLAHESNCGIGTLTLTWADTSDLPGGQVQILTVFSMINVRLEPGDGPLKFNAVLIQPGAAE